MKTTAEMIAVMQAAERGEKIQVQEIYSADEEWMALIYEPGYRFNFERFNYRIKPREPAVRPLDLAVDAVCGQWNMHRPDVRRILEIAMPVLLAAQSGDMHQHLLDMLGAKDHADAGRIIGELHAAEIKSR